MDNKTWENLVDALTQEGILRSPEVILAMRLVPREKFLPDDAKSYGSMDVPLPIGLGQTVSAPHMVSIMNEALELEVGHRVLEVGAGCGWHSATVAEIVAPSDVAKEKWGHVYTIEIVDALAKLAKKNIEDAGFDDRVTIIHGDGSLGYAEKAPYDRILVTAAAPEVPPPLVEQLRVGGVMVLPVGGVQLFQTLVRVRKAADGHIIREDLGGVAFVPLTGRHGHHM